MFPINRLSTYKTIIFHLGGEERGQRSVPQKLRREVVLANLGYVHQI